VENNRRIQVLKLTGPINLILLALPIVLYSQKKELVSAEQIFTDIYDRKAWWTGESFSGCGSNLHPTQLIRQEIPRIIRQYNIKSMLDLPCGDFHWMKEINLEISYIGADIV
jgi:hypothetical protein